MSLSDEVREQRYRAAQRRGQERYAKTAKGYGKRLWSNAKTNSRTRGMPPPTITLEWIRSKLDAGCPISGLPFSYTGGAHNPYAPSLDRKDCSLPYTPENTQVVLWAVNLGMGVWGQQTYLAIARAALRHAQTV